MSLWANGQSQNFPAMSRALARHSDPNPKVARQGHDQRQMACKPQTHISGSRAI
jgi:hypothetical protein